MAKKLLLRSFTWAVTFTSLFVLTIGAILIALVVGDWISIQTNNAILAWVVGIFVMFGFLCTLGAGVGFFIWLRGPETPAEIRDRNVTMDHILRDATSADRD